jgi:hypothetical protein
VPGFVVFTVEDARSAVGGAGCVLAWHSGVLGGFVHAGLVAGEARGVGVEGLDMDASQAADQY